MHVNHLRHLFGNTGLTAQQKNAGIAPRKHFTQALKEFGAFDVLLQRHTQHSGSNLDAHTVGQHQCSARQQAAITTVMGSDIDAGRIDNTHLLGPRTVEHLRNPLHRLRHADVVKRNIANADTRLADRTGQGHPDQRERAQQQGKIVPHAALVQVFNIGFAL